MRNIFKRSERHNRSRRPNRGVSAIAASIASAALVAGLGSYPVGAQDTTVPSSSSVSSEVAPSTVTEPDTSAPDTSVPASSAWPSSVEAPSGPVQVSRAGDIDRIVIDDPDGEVWGYGAKASMEDIFGITRSGSGEIEEILKVAIDGEELDPQFFGFVNDPDGGVLAFDLDALNEIPPRHVEFEVRTAASATYVIAESDEVPTAKDLNAQSTYGKTADAAATVNPNASGTLTINGQPRNSGSTTTEAPKADGPLSGEYKLPLGPARLSTAPGTPEKVLTSELLGDLTRQVVYPTRLRISYSGEVDNTTTSLSGPVTFTKNGTETCTVQNPRPVETQRQPRGGTVVTAIEIDLRSCPQKFWEGNGDTISVRFNGPAGDSGDYTMEVWGRRAQGNSGVQPNPNDGIVDANGKCVSDDPETKVQPREGKRTITDDEKRRGTEIYVSTSAAANGSNTDRSAMTHTLLSLQPQGSNQFVPVGSSNWIYNGLAYNPEDNWLYGISQHRGSSSNQDPCYPAGHLLQIDPVTGAVRDLGAVKNGGSSPFKDQNGARDRTLINTGVFYNGDLYVSNSSTSGSRDIYKVVLPAVGANNPTGTNRNFKGYSEDYAVLPEAPQYAWGIVSAGAYQELEFGYRDSNGRWVNSNGVYIERINLATGKVDRWELSTGEKRANTGESLEKKTTWGKAWTYGNGNLGFAQGGDSANQANPGVQISITNPGARQPIFEVVGLLNQAPDSYNTDAASNARRQPPSESDLAVEKVAISKEDGKTYPGFDKNAMTAGRTYWAVRVTNLGPDTSPGAVVTDVVPSAYEDVRLMNEYRTQKDGYETLVQLSPNNRRPSANGLFGTGDTDVQYILGEMQQGDEVWMYLSAKLKSNQQCVPNRASVVNNDVDPDPENDTDQSECPPIVEIHKNFVGDTRDGSHLIPVGDKTYQVKYRITVTNKTADEVWYDPPIDAIFVPQGMTLTKATSVYTNEWGNKTITCNIDGNNEYLKPADFKSNATTRFRLQDCRKVDSEYKGFDGRRTESFSANAARDHRHIDAAKTVGGRVVTGSHTYDVTAEFKLDENAYLDAYPSYGREGGVCNAKMGGLVNQAWIGLTPSELPCTTPPIDRPSLKLKKIAGDRSEENLSNSGVEFTIYKSNGGEIGDKAAQLIPDGDALRTEGKLSYNQDYFLVETRAPAGFSLLTEPIPFKIVKENGIAKVVLANSSVVAEAGKGEGSLAVMTVANIRQGNLPKTGGLGVQFPALLGGALVAAGVFLGRRRLAR